VKTIKNRIYNNFNFCNYTVGIIENKRFEKCTFGGRGNMFFSVGIRRPSDIFTIRNCEFVNCTFYDRFGGLEIGQTIVENVLIENCKTKGTFGLTLDKTMLKHVTIKGQLDVLCISTFGNKFDFEDKFSMLPFQRELYSEDSDFWSYYYSYGTQYLYLEEANRMKAYFLDFYKACDWVLDIKEAKIGYHQILGIFPFDKIKYNPTIQAYINKEKLMSGKWKELIEKLDNKGLAESALNYAFELKTDGVLIIADYKNPKWYNAELEVIRLLREHGIADPGETAMPVIIPPKKVKPAVNFKKPVFVFRVTVWSYDHGDGILLANNASSAKKKMMELLNSLETDPKQYTAKREKKFDSIANKLEGKIWHETDEMILRLTDKLK
jgi:hypothetical protein